MCGLIGLFTNNNFSLSAFNNGLNSLLKRGPDFRGTWMEPGVHLGHQRLSILDLDSRANQPMSSICGNYIIVFNGEIYNYIDLKNNLISLGFSFNTNSDTEVLLNLYIYYKEEMLSHLKGMFSFIIWDKFEKKAFIARDPYGIKPLYYGLFSNGIIFSSQVKSILATNLIDLKPELNSQFSYWMFGSVPDPLTFFKNIYSVKPGYYIIIKNCEISSYEQWFDIGEVWRTNDRINHCKLTKEDIISNVKSILNESVKRHLVSDVPIGIFLSGGIDSAVLAGLIKENSNNDIIAITIAFDEFRNTNNDESIYAAQIAKHFGLTHHIRKVTKKEFLKDLPLILKDMDQPSIDGINTWYASKAASELKLKVVISGVGGDELFLGYNNFTLLPRLVKIWKILKYIPGFFIMSKLVFNIIARFTNNSRWKYAANWLCSIEGAWCLSRSTLSPDVANSKLKHNYYENEIKFNPKDWIQSNTGEVSKDLTLALAHIESTNYLRNQLLRDSDWASMSHSIELRTPLVDVFLLEQLKPYLKYFREFPAKSLLTNSLKYPLPKSILNKPKTGFTIPVKSWINEYLNNNSSWQDEVVKRIYS